MLRKLDAIFVQKLKILLNEMIILVKKPCKKFPVFWGLTEK